MRRKKIVPAGMIACVLSGIILTAPVQETAGTPGQVLYVSAAKRATTTTTQSATKEKEYESSEKDQTKQEKSPKIYWEKAEQSRQGNREI